MSGKMMDCPRCGTVARITNRLQRGWSCTHGVAKGPPRTRLLGLRVAAAGQDAEIAVRQLQGQFVLRPGRRGRPDAGRRRADQPYTLGETMEAGGCWRIDHDTRINRGYVYASDFILDADPAPPPMGRMAQKV